MPDEPTNQDVDPNQQSAPGGEGDSDQTPTTPDPTQLALDAAKAAAEAARQQAAEWRELAAKAVSSSPAPAPAPSDDDDIPEDLDPNVLKIVDKKVKKMRDEIATVYQQDRQMQMQRNAMAERERASALPEWDTYKSEIETYMSQVPIDVQASPGAWQEAYYAIVGKHATEDAIRKRSAPPRADVVTSSTRTEPDHPAALISDSDKAFLQESLGIDMNDDELKALNGKTVSIQDWRAAAGGES